MRRLAFLVCLGSLACGEETVEPILDLGPRDAGGLDLGAAPDAAGPADAGSEDAAGPEDAGSPDLGYRPGCGEARFRQGPLDPGAAGPWPVGVRTATVAGLEVEIWYPAVPGSESAAAAPARYDLRRVLPRSEAGKIADAENPFLACDCYRGLPLDTSRGPYPVIVFVHGTAGFRAQSVSQTAHWASRGFVVLAADHPGLFLKDVLAAACGQGMVPRDVEDEVRRLVMATRTSTGGLAFLSGQLDVDRLGLSGHSAGGRAVAGLGDLGRVIAPLAAGGVTAGAALESVLVMGGTSDRVVPVRQQIEGYASAPAPKRLVLLDNAGHLAFSAFCALENDAGQNIVEVAQASGVCGTQLASFLFDCNPAYLSDADAWEVVEHATTAAFESVLQCRAGSEAELSATAERFDAVADFREDL